MIEPKRNIILAIVVALIVFSIGYLEFHKPHNGNGVELPLPVAISTSAQNRIAIFDQKSKEYSRAKELAGIQGYINTQKFALSDLVGKKVVLLDFWTYSCINCIRTIPYLNSWYEKYKDQGLVIVGVHTPEFDFEKIPSNVEAGVRNLKVQYPTVLDSNYGTWDAYGNQYWPHEYLIDIDGFIVHDHIGEGDYDVTEKAIQSALRERAKVLGLPDTISSSVSQPFNIITMTGEMVRSPETYFGFARNQYLGNGNRGIQGQQTLAALGSLDSNTLYLDGIWNFEKEYAQNINNVAKIFYNYSAKNVYLVGSSGIGVKIKILRDGKPLGGEAGKDVAADGTVLVKENRLYDLIHGSSYGDHTIEIDIEGKGLNAFAFTFG